MARHGWSEPAFESYCCLLLGRSRSLSAVYVTIGMLAIAALSLLSLPTWGLIFGGACCLLPVTDGLLRHGLRSIATAPVRIELLPGAGCRLTDRRGDTLDMGSWRVELAHPWLIILRLPSAAGRRGTTVLIAADAVAAEEHRQLRVRLRRVQPDL